MTSNRINNETSRDELASLVREAVSTVRKRSARSTDVVHVAQPEPYDEAIDSVIDMLRSEGRQVVLDDSGMLEHGEILVTDREGNSVCLYSIRERSLMPGKNDNPSNN